MQNTWFEQDLRSWTNISDNIATNQKATYIINLAKVRLEKNEGYVEASSGSVGLKNLEIMLNKYFERKKLGYVISIVENFLDSGHFELKVPDQNLTELQIDDYMHISEIIKQAILSHPKPEKCKWQITRPPFGAGGE